VILRPSLRIRIEAKPHKVQYIICFFSLSQYNRLSVWFVTRTLVGHLVTGMTSPRRTEVARGKRVKIAAKKRKRTLTEAAGSHSAAVLRAPAPPYHCGSTATTVCTDSSLTVQWTSESGATEFSVHLPSAADTTDISVSELHAYPDRIHFTSSAGTSPPLRHCIP
jgi:hypothetical protein